MDGVLVLERDVHPAASELERVAVPLAERVPKVELTFQVNRVPPVPTSARNEVDQ